MNERSSNMEEQQELKPKRTRNVRKIHAVTISQDGRPVATMIPPSTTREGIIKNIQAAFVSDATLGPVTLVREVGVVEIATVTKQVTRVR